MQENGDLFAIFYLEEAAEVRSFFNSFTSFGSIVFCFNNLALTALQVLPHLKSLVLIKDNKKNVDFDCCRSTF